MKNVSQDEKTSWNSKKCYCDGKAYNSLFSLTVDFGISFSSFYQKLKKNNFAPITYSGHTIVLAGWLEQHPEYDINGNTPAGGINTGKEANK